jgi:hypothetical protein
MFTHIVPPSSADDVLPRRVIVAYARMSSLARPCDREEQGALFEGFDVMRHSLINRQEAARAEIERPSGSPHLNVARQHVDSDPSLGFMFGHPRLGSQRDQDDAKIVVLDERSRILTGVPCSLGLQAMNFGLQVELHERVRHRRCVRSMMGLVVGRVGHQLPPLT